MKRVLFVCSQNRLRSPTAEQVFSSHAGIECMSAGTNRDADNPLTAELVEWADVIFVMEKTHRNKLAAKFRPQLANKRIVCLDIPDEYEFMDPELVRILEVRVPKFLALAQRTRSRSSHEPFATATLSPPASQERLMPRISRRLDALGLALPAPLQLPPGASLPFPWVRVVGRRAIVSGHGPTNVDGSLAQPRGKVGRDVTLEQARFAARLTGLAILGSLERALGDLDRIQAWVRVFGMVNSAPGFNQQPAVINGFTELIVELFGPDVGSHARSAVGMAELPFDIPVEIEAEVELVSG